MKLTDVCRLCLAEENLVWIFDQRFENSENMKDVILTTTGVEIHSKDLISQKICKKCCEIAVKMLQFRTKSLENNQHLKELLKEHLKNVELKIPNTDVTITSDINEKKKEEKPVIPKAGIKVHTSVQSLFRDYPQIKIPTRCLEFHIDPHVFMQMDTVENYFIEQKIDMNKHIQVALRCSREPKKHLLVNEDNRMGEGKGADKRTAIRPDKLNEKSENDIVAVPLNSINETDKSDLRVKPINIKLNTDNPTCTIIEKGISQQDMGDRNKNIPKITSEAVKSTYCEQKDNVSKTEKVQSNKRKLSETESVLPGQAKKSVLIESSHLSGKTSDTVETMYVDKSVPLYICEICNSVQYNAKDLKKHQFKHLRCQFCKAKFRTMEQKTQHLASHCPIKNIMNNLPTILLMKIEMDKEARFKYRDAFVGFPPLLGMDLIKNNNIDVNNDQYGKSEPSKLSDLLSIRKPKRRKKTHVTADSSSMEVIEILSDDDERETDANKSEPKHTKKFEKLFDAITPPTSHSNSPTVSVSTTLTSSANSPVPFVSTTSSNHTNSPVSSVSTTLTTNTNSTIASVITAFSTPSIGENVVYNTVSIVKPDIKIKNNSRLDKFDSKTSDIKVLKELLSDYKSLKSTKDAFAQTYLPTNNLIVTNKSDCTCDLMYLKQQLHMYKIPVKVNNGTFCVSYIYEKPPEKQKKICLWNDLTPIEIKVSNSTSSISYNNVQKENRSSSITTPKSPGVPPKRSTNGPMNTYVISNSKPLTTAIVTDARHAQKQNITPAVRTNYAKAKIISYSSPYGLPNLQQNVSTPALSTSAPSAINIPDGSGQNASETITVNHQSKLLTPTSVSSTPLTMNVGARLPGPNISDQITVNNQNKFLVPVSSVATAVVLNGTLKSNMDSTTSGHNNISNNMTVIHQNKTPSPKLSVTTPLAVNVRPEQNVVVTYGSNSYNFPLTTPITTPVSISNMPINLPLIPANNVTHSDPMVIHDSSNTPNIILNNYIGNSNVSGHSSTSLTTNEVNPKPGAIRVKNVWELK